MDRNIQINKFEEESNKITNDFIKIQQQVKELMSDKKQN